MSQLNVGTVNATTITTGQTGVQFHDGTSVSTSPIGSMSLNDLTDLTAGSPGVNQQLTWNGSAWVPQTSQQNIVKVWANGGHYSEPNLLQSSW